MRGGQQASFLHRKAFSNASISVCTRSHAARDPGVVIAVLAKHSREVVQSIMQQHKTASLTTSITLCCHLLMAGGLRLHPTFMQNRHILVLNVGVCLE